MAGGVIEFSPEAEQELEELFLWIAVDIGPNAAEAFAERVRRATENLAAFPMIGRVRDEYSHEPRSLSVHPGVIFYEPLKGRRGIRVLRVLDGRRNLDALLGRRLP